MTFSHILAAILFFNFEKKKDKIELGIGQIWNQGTKIMGFPNQVEFIG